ncbi:MAG: RNA methyltransferase [Bacteroidales bacterium]|nr:RNA methyltransferase [Candidatus Colimorpha onthohippi]
MVVAISDLNAPELAPYCRLTEAQLRNKLEPSQGVFIAESPKVVRVALDYGYTPLSILTTERHLHGDAEELLRLCPPDMPIYVAPGEKLVSLTGYELTRGVLCAMRRPQLPSVETVCAGAHRMVLLDGVVNATNTGAIFRAAAALGIDGVLLTPTCSDPFNRRSVRVSMGTVFQVPWCYVSSVVGNQPCEVLSMLRQLGFLSAAMALTPRAIAVDNPLLQTIDKMVIVMGTEGDGLSKAMLDCCDYIVQIPMQNNVDSLNVAAAAAVAFWQLRKR